MVPFFGLLDLIGYNDGKQGFVGSEAIKKRRRAT
jgi:hypothetical protein